MRILGLGGSIRGVNPKAKKFITDLVAQHTNLAEYIKAVDEVNARVPAGVRPILSNTEIMTGAALIGAKEIGAEVEFFPVSRLFSRREGPQYEFDSSRLGLDDDVMLYDMLKLDETKRQQLVSAIKAADGVILSSPVYFGDRSSISNKVLQIALAERLLEGKLVAAISCGAKRNGGQETTNIYTLNEANLMGAYVVGNGPKSCQYGGTGVAGDLGKITKDEWGMETALATGRRIAQVASVLSKPKPVQPTNAKIAVLVSMDTPDRMLAKMVKEKVEALGRNYPHVNFTVLELIDGDIERCLACNICPVPELLTHPKDSYACIIQTKRDSMAPIRDVMNSVDGFILAGLNLNDMSTVNFRYQAFTERTRFIRRNDFELTNVPVTSFTFEEVGAQSNKIFDLKVMTSYMRHNSIMCPPIRDVAHKGQVLVKGDQEFARYVESVVEITSKRQVSTGFKTSYKAGGFGGYADTSLDHTEAVRG